MKKRVVITGVGMITPIANDLETFWSNIVKGNSGIKSLERFDSEKFKTKVAAEVIGFNSSDYIDAKEAKRMDLFTQYAMAATSIAIKDSMLDLNKVCKERFGVVIGTGVGGLQTIEEEHKVLIEKGPGRVSPFLVPMIISNIATGQIAINYSARGYCSSPVNACAASASAIGEAFRELQEGREDVIIAGGAEASITPLAFAGFCSMRAMSTNTDILSACRPFDKERDGFVMGEGAGIVILETLEHAVCRGAKIYAEILGCGRSNDANHITTPSEGGYGMALSMQKALDDANVHESYIDYINAHGTATKYNDRDETLAIKRVFSKNYPFVSSTKAMTGHMLGASGAIEAIITTLALKEGFLPPTINHQTDDEECDLDYVFNKGRKQCIDIAMSNSFGFGGVNVSLIFKKW